MKHYHPANSCAIVCGAQIIDVLDGSKTEFNPLGWRGMRLQGHRTIVPVPDGWLEQHKPVPGAYLIQDHDARTTVVPEAMFLSCYHRASPADDGEYTLWPIRTTGAEAQTARAELQQLGRPIKGPVQSYGDPEALEFRRNWDRERAGGAMEGRETTFENLAEEMDASGATGWASRLRRLGAASEQRAPVLRFAADMTPADIEQFKEEFKKAAQGAVRRMPDLVIGRAPVPVLPTRVTKEALEAMFRSVTYEIRPDGRTTVCEVTFKNGFTLRDESACAHIDNFNQQLGEQQAYKKALDLAWGYAGFLLMEDRYRAGAA